MPWRLWAAIHRLKDLNKIPDNFGWRHPAVRPASVRAVGGRDAPDGRQKDLLRVTPRWTASRDLMQFVAKMLNDPSANPVLLVDALRDKSNFARCLRTCPELGGAVWRAAWIFPIWIPRFTFVARWKRM